MEQDKIHQLAVFYYSRKDVQEAIFNFCQNKETVPRYYEGFGKRPDSLQYPSEIMQQVKKGATSFHCSEEIWGNPLNLSTELSKEQMNELRTGWDLLIDIDCKWFDYAKIAALAVVEVLRNHRLNNFRVKFSGSKGFHIIVPWKAFPEEVNGAKTKEGFPEWARIIAEYIKIKSAPIFEQRVVESGREYEKLDKDVNEIKMKCNSCGDLAQKFNEVTFYCPTCKISETVKILDAGKLRKCPHCRKELVKKDEREFYVCSKCKLDSRKDSSFSISAFDTNSVSAFDIVLVSPRHLFRCPYSLHEKTGFSSIVLDEDEIENFKPSDASPLKIKIKNFYPNAEKDEAKELFISALEWHGDRQRHIESKTTAETKSRPGKKFEEITVDKSTLVYPPSIKKILEGMEDGKKRALFILLNFFRSLGFSKEEIEEKIKDWNKKNKKKLKEEYIKAQIVWTFNQKKRLPPNYDKPFYRDIGIQPDDEELRLKNPVSYVIRKSRWEKDKK